MLASITVSLTTHIITYTYLLLIFQVKTRSEMAVLFYNTGPNSNQDYVALELWKGRPRLLVDQVRQNLIFISFSIPKFYFNAKNVSKQMTKLELVSKE